MHSRNSTYPYPSFGMTMNGRTYNNESYRFGFNGKERDLEGMGGGGSTYDYGFRIYNPQLGKFLSVDPLTKTYPFLTPYQFASNRPIFAIDIDGLEAIAPAPPAAVPLIVPISNAPNATPPLNCNNGCTGAGPVTANQQLVMWDYQPDVKSKDGVDANGLPIYSYYFAKYRTYNVSAEVNQRYEVEKNAMNDGKGERVGAAERSQKSNHGWMISYAGRCSPPVVTNTTTINNSVDNFIGTTNQQAGAVTATNRNATVSNVLVAATITSVTFTYHAQVAPNGFRITNTTTGALVLNIPAAPTPRPVTVNIAPAAINPGDNLVINNNPQPILGMGDQMDYNLSISQQLNSGTVTTSTPGTPTFTGGSPNPPSAPTVKNVTKTTTNVNTVPTQNR